MKKGMFLTLAIVLLVGLAACGGTPPGELVPSDSQSEATLPSISAPTPTPTPAPPPEHVENQEIALQLSLLGNPAEFTGTYTGEMVDGLPHGHGSFTTTNVLGKARTYTGGWNAGHLSGEGQWQHSGVRVVAEGTYDNDLLIQGTLYYGNDKIRYEGEFRNGLPNLDAAARQARIDGYHEVAVRLEYGGDKGWADYLDQLVTEDRQVAEIVPDVASYTLIYSDDVGSANFFPSYGEPLPQPGDNLQVYLYPYAEVAPDTGVATIYQDVLAVVIQ